MSQRTAYCAPGRVLATAESAFALRKSGIFRENSVTVTTGTVTSTTASFAQGMESVIAGTVSAGMDGTEMHVKSGLAQSILNSYTGEDWSLHFSIRTI